MELSKKVVWKVYSTGVSALAALATGKAVNGGWKFVTGSEPPEPSDPQVPTGEAAAWVLIVSVGLGLSQVLVNRFLARRWEAWSGEASPLRSVNVKL